MSSNNIPFISVVIPTYNRAGLIKKTIECVLAQTYRDFEIIIIDDGSKDNTNEVAASFNNKNIRYIKHPKNLGATAARNTGIKAAGGEWIAFLDSDDIWLNDKLEKQVKAINCLPDDYAVIHCGIQYFDFETGEFISERIARENINEVVKSNLGVIPQTSSMLIKKSALFDIGMFDEKLPAMQEAELGLKLAQKYKFKLVDEFLVHCIKNHDQIMSKPSLYVNAKEIVLENHRNLLSRELIFNYCNIIAGDSIVNNNIPKAKKYLKEAIKYKFSLKPFLSFLAINIFPVLLVSLYKKKYIKNGWSK
jgi:glycosyltransferase involved in cell wall biosynthesis